MDEQQEFPELGGNDPVVERMVRRSKRSKLWFRRILWFLGVLGGLGLRWCVYLAVTSQYERLGMVLMVLLAIVGLTLKGYSYLRTLEEFENR